jgi:hypothetical protein
MNQPMRRAESPTRATPGQKTLPACSPRAVLGQRNPGERNGKPEHRSLGAIASRLAVISGLLAGKLISLAGQRQQPYLEAEEFLME